MNKASRSEKIAYGIFILVFTLLLGYILNLSYFQSVTAWTILVLALIFASFGAALGVPKLFAEFREDGHWKFDLLRFLLTGIPIILIMVLFLIDPGQNYDFYMFLYNLQPYLLNFNILFFMSILFGYLLITSFHKQADYEACEDDECCSCCCATDEEDETEIPAPSSEEDK